MSLSKFFESRNTSDSSPLANLFQITPPKMKTPKPLPKPQPMVEEQPKPQKQEPEKQLPQNLQSTIFIGNIPLASTHKEIKKYFSSFGKVQKVWFRSIPTQQSKIPKKAAHILKKYQEGANSMNGYVKFQTIDQAKNACSANGQKINEHNIRVTMCKEFEIDYEKTIFIGNLPLNVKDQQVWDAFKDVGKIESVRIIRKKFSMEGIGIGYVKFSSKEDMKKAIKQMNGKEIGERAMRIKKAVEKERLQKKFKNVEKKKVKAGKMLKEKYRMGYKKDKDKGNVKGNKSMRFRKQNSEKKWKTKSIKKQ